MMDRLHSDWESEQATASAHSLYDVAGEASSPRREMWPRAIARGRGDVVGPWIDAGPLDWVVRGVAVFRSKTRQSCDQPSAQWQCCEAVLGDAPAI